MIVREYTIQAAEGMHARPATSLVKLARTFQSSIQLKKEEKQIELNSLLNILSLAIKFGDLVSVIINGSDENEAVVAIDIFFDEQLKGL